jgi:flagellar protein FliS
MTYGFAKANQAYTNVALQSCIESACPHRLVQMLFDGALQRIAQAKGAMQRQEYAAKAVAINKAIAVVSGLQGSLDRSVEHELTQNLDDLYDYLVRQLQTANLNNDLAILDEVSNLLRELKAAWDEIPSVLGV